MCVCGGGGGCIMMCLLSTSVLRLSLAICNDVLHDALGIRKINDNYFV